MMSIIYLIDHKETRKGRQKQFSGIIPKNHTLTSMKQHTEHIENYEQHRHSETTYFINFKVLGYEKKN